MNWREQYRLWLESDYFDQETKEELLKIKDDEKEIEDRFYTGLKFGTAGMRGEIGAGTNRINIYVVRRTTQGLARYIEKSGKKEQGVVIAYDSRRKSREFANETAKVLAANGIRVYLFDELRPVPELSFAVRELKTIAGVVITASHNPKEYNGYKVYWEDGAQPVTDITDRISEEIDKISDYSNVKLVGMDEAVEKGLINYIGKEMDDRYIRRVKQSSLNPRTVSKVADSFSIVYTPLNGTGNKLVRKVLSEIGFKNVLVIKEQELPDSEFTTCNPPNPEKRQAMDLGIQMAKRENVDLVLATDPDADRLGVAVKTSEGEYEILTGNQIGCIILEYILSQKKEKDILPEKGVVVKTVVTTELARAIAGSYGMETTDVHVGFKNIAEQINKAESEGNKAYIFGFEESFGYLAGTHARDKDAVEAAMLVAEAAAFYRDRGMTLYDGLLEIYEKYGYHIESNVSFTLKGSEGAEKISSMMSQLRGRKPGNFGGVKVGKMKDYLEGAAYEPESGAKSLMDAKKANVLYFEFENGGWFAIRPSGTEPLIKLYFGAKGRTRGEADNEVEKLKENILPEIKKMLGMEE